MVGRFYEGCGLIFFVVFKVVWKEMDGSDGFLWWLIFSFSFSW